MNSEKIEKSFSMRFGRACEQICFCGKGITFLEGSDACLCASVSAGGYLAVARRTDGRFTAEFDDSQKYISSNVSELVYHNGEPLLEFLEQVQKCGVTLGGADVLFRFDTEIYKDFEPLLLSGTYTFCKKTVPPLELKACLTKESAFVEMIGKKGTLLFSQDGRYEYIKISDKAVKVVLCYIEEENQTGRACDICVKNAAKYLAIGDYVNFGEIITNEYKESIKAGKVGRKTKELFSLALKLKDGLGYGILKDGGIFAVVENKKVNAFVQNIRTEYENYCGAPPDFYITRTENSGINAIKKTYKAKEAL